MNKRRHRIPGLFARVTAQLAAELGRPWPPRQPVSGRVQRHREASNVFRLTGERS